MLNPICVRLPNWVGDACMSLPALRLLANAGFPLVMVGRPWARDLLAGLQPYRFVALEGPWRTDVDRMRMALRAAQGEQPALPPGRLRGICFPDSISSALVFRLAGVRAAGYRDDGRSLLLKWPVTKPRGELHVVESYYYLARAVLHKWGLGGGTSATPESVLDLPMTSGHQQAARAVVENAGFARPFVLISPTATGLHKGRVKAWPHYEALTRILIANGWAVAMCPPPNEVDAARAAAPSALLLPALPLCSYAALTRLAALVICNDSGTSHVAAAACSRQLTLFGVTRQARTRPWSPTARCLGADNAWPSLEDVAAGALDMLRNPPA